MARNSVRGVELNIICGGIPVITLDKACVFHENVSWMLQSALNASGKADSLYEYCDDEKVIAEGKKLGLSEDELSIVRLKAKELRHVKAVGTTGKRSVMLAVVVELRSYKLDKAFIGLLESGQQSVVKKHLTNGGDCDSSWSSGWGAHWDKGEDWSKYWVEPRPGKAKNVEAPVEPPDGVELSVVCGKVPVLDLDKSSIFHENVSWLLQTAMGSSGKADSLYEYTVDREIMSACRKQLKLTDQEVGLVVLKRPELQHVKAVGTAGKRSIMLSVVVALVLHDEVQCDNLQKEVWDYDSKLYKPFDQLIRAAKGEVAVAGLPATGWGGGGGMGAATKESRKRKWFDDDDGGWNSWWQPFPASKVKKAGGGRASKEEPSHEALDKQLDEYWGEETMSRTSKHSESIRDD